ncbi:uncharacterized protein PFL1_01344 [Pseudozyma flocculosa PF-1]|uniref:Probable OPT1 - High-affinity glutathione transporter n=1 Tax=Pseudozyma flocculosa TaxID=84751 RepID=A0A5C3EZ87_9BASI|nr:uncharacterized protein PFL1_01344 [Pseudozyma flocculosa PF-1]EPQ31156.1 hypothetical protein PFL1_01344 [Pseudozyma flocculosa PF-1]SPO36351.1 probable OPT1 - High-affinity glutathione transporter [Pseudozyma flocculosa]
MRPAPQAETDDAPASPSLSYIARRPNRHTKATVASEGSTHAVFDIGRDSQDAPASPPSLGLAPGSAQSSNIDNTRRSDGRRPHSIDSQDDYDEDDIDDEAALMLDPASASTSDLREDDDGAIELGPTAAKRVKRRIARARGHRPTGSLSAKYDKDDPLFLVSKAVPEDDDPSLPALTWRALVIGSFFCVIGAAVSQLFFYKSNSPSFSTYFVILISLPVGKWLARKLPDKTIWIGPWSFELNPGPFSIKEHMLVAIISSSGASSAGATDIINIQELFYHQRMPWLASLTLLISSQVLGFGWAGLVTDLLVKPPSMLWPSTLVTTSLFHTLHDGKSPYNKARLRMFFLVFIAIFVYQFLPAMIAPTLSSIAVLCLVNNQNQTFRILSSGYHGLGLLNFTLDWNAAGMTGPFYQPWWAALNFYGGIAGMCWIIAPLYYFGFNMWQARSFPDVLGSGLYHQNFTKFDVTGLLNPDSTLDRDKWEESKPMLLTPFFALTYGLSFATLTSVLTHTLLWHWNDIKRAVNRHEHDDIHNRLMRAYAPVPRSWYWTTFGLTTMAACILVVTTPSLQLPVWALLMAIFMGPIFLVPVGILRAVSDTGVGLNVISEFVIGYIMPGNPIGNVLFKIMAYMSLAQALDLLTDLKCGHYLKVPPKHMFVSQLVGTAIGCVVNLVVVNIILDPASGYRGFLDGTVEDPSGQWDGRKVHIFFSASVIWGLIGPAEFFAGEYRILYAGFLIGALLPLIPYLLHKRYGGKMWNKVAWPIILHGACAPPTIPTNVIMTGFALSWLSQKHLRTRHPKWFERFNYVVSAALDAGASVNALAIFLLSVTIMRWSGPIPNWAGNPSSDSEYCKPAVGPGAPASAT